MSEGLLARWVADVPLAALDFETTGLHPHRGDRVVEVAVVRGEPDGSVRRWHSLVNPERRVAATQIHGITDAMVAASPPFSGVLPTLRELLHGAVLVAHNAPFDVSFLDLECKLAGAIAPSPPVIDTLGLARRLLALGDHRLGTLVARYGFHREHAHRALDDADVTLQLARRLLSDANPDGHLSVRDAMALCRRRSPEEAEAHYARIKALEGGAPVLVDYLSGDAPAEPPTRREITVRKVSRSRVEAWCHLRNDKRTFRLDRMRIVEGS